MKFYSKISIFNVSSGPRLIVLWCYGSLLVYDSPTPSMDYVSYKKSMDKILPKKMNNNWWKQIPKVTDITHRSWTTGNSQQKWVPCFGFHSKQCSSFPGCMTDLLKFLCLLLCWSFLFDEVQFAYFCFSLTWRDIQKKIINTNAQDLVPKFFF